MNAQVYEKQNGQRCRITPGMRQLRLHWLFNMFLIGDNNVFDFQTMIVFCEFTVIDRRNCIFAMENDIFARRNAFLLYLRI